MLAAVILLGMFLPRQDSLRDLAEQHRWDEVIATAEERLDADPGDSEAHYWAGRASVERALVLLQGRTFSRDLARAILGRARDQLAMVAPTSEGPTSDADEWEVYARYLHGNDPELGQDLERWYETEGRGYAAYLRGLMAVDAADDDAAVAWFGKASQASPERPLFALEWADALSRVGLRREAFQAWALARDHDADLQALLGRLLSILPAEGDAADRLAKLDTLLSRPGAEDDGMLAWYRAYSLEQLGRAGEAEQVLARATSNRTWDVDRAHARLLGLEGRREDAARMLVPIAREGDQKALEQLIDLADTAAGKRLWDEGLSYYDQALSVEPKSERAALNRALLLSQAGRSLDAYRALLDRYASRSDILNDAALAAWGWGEQAESQEWFERAIGMPGASNARENLAALLLDSGGADSQRVMALLDTVLTDEPNRDRALFLRHLARQSPVR